MKRFILQTACAAVLGLAAITTTATAAERLTFVSWGGSTQSQQEQAWAEPFAEQSDIRVVQAGPTDYGKLKAMVDSGNVEWDVVDVEAEFAFRAAEQGLLEPLDYSHIDKDNLDPRFYFDHGVGSFYFSFVLAYNTAVLSGEPPRGWEALFDTETYPGKRTLYKWPSPGVIELALLADGVEPDKLYPLDVERALAKLDTIKDDIIWWSTGAESQQLLASGEVSLGQFWNGRVYTMKQEEAPVETDWHQNLAYADFLVVPKGAPNKDAAMRFLGYSSSAEGQAQFANLSAYAPVNTASETMLDADMVDALPTAHKNEQISLSSEYWAEHGEEIAKRWNAWLLE